MKERSVAKLIQIAQGKFNLMIRLRDEGKGCISCNALTFSDCGHLFQKSTRPAMRFIPEAAHGQCRMCNSLPDGNYESMCKGIAARYGVEYLTNVIQQANNSRKESHKWNRTELEELILYFEKLIKDLNN